MKRRKSSSILDTSGTRTRGMSLSHQIADLVFSYAMDEKTLLKFGQCLSDTALHRLAKALDIEKRSRGERTKASRLSQMFSKEIHRDTKHGSDGKQSFFFPLSLVEILDASHEEENFNDDYDVHQGFNDGFVTLVFEVLTVQIRNIKISLRFEGDQHGSIIRNSLEIWDLQELRSEKVLPELSEQKSKNGAGFYEKDKKARDDFANNNDSDNKAPVPRLLGQYETMNLGCSPWNRPTLFNTFQKSKILIRHYLQQSKRLIQSKSGLYSNETTTGFRGIFFLELTNAILKPLRVFRLRDFSVAEEVPPQ